ncbi:MAG: hypothetical protein QOK23_1640 [Gammaproteobacteria bacterium]|nr:hypothetical protein [Gammaproteobacteria bacterium]
MQSVERAANLWEFTNEFTDPLDIANKIRTEAGRPLIEVQCCGLKLFPRLRKEAQLHRRASFALKSANT